MPVSMIPCCRSKDFANKIPSSSSEFNKLLEDFYNKHGKTITPPIIDGVLLNLERVFRAVADKGGYEAVTLNKWAFPILVWSLQNQDLSLKSCIIRHFAFMLDTRKSRRTNWCLLLYHTEFHFMWNTRELNFCMLAGNVGICAFDVSELVWSFRPSCFVCMITVLLVEQQSGNPAEICMEGLVFLGFFLTLLAQNQSHQSLPLISSLRQY